ncbi:hypothetical protein GGI11_000024 [Coemansia sp. RSA 2049]|nr:hypothetical protein H4217_000969 [Coemansia sp. RSA 1939]KAJ2525452.1 hypothetical protein GGI11_000024 [Coemansia sp. RSA 2049]KAJ2607650.1 hypothetical protein EV177_005397 [Coemansia sp. RSA 1804]KAJ2681551.1 hypothetical protein GGH99_005148 [Coemansia sp. RSA 1285]
MEQRQQKRRRLFTRRELRRRGTYVVQVGTQNVLQKRSGRFTYAQAEELALPADSQGSGSDPAAPADHVSAEDARPLAPSAPDSITSIATNTAEADNGTNGGSSGGCRKRHRRLSQLHRRLDSSAQQLSLPLPPPLPPPLDIDTDILSFPEAGTGSRRTGAGAWYRKHRRRQTLSHSTANKIRTSGAATAAGSSRRKRALHLTPLHAVSERLGSAVMRRKVTQ